jgi:hypothetical protein
MTVKLSTLAILTVASIATIGVGVYIAPQQSVVSNVAAKSDRLPMPQSSSLCDPQAKPDDLLGEKLPCIVSRVGQGFGPGGGFGLGVGSGLTGSDDAGPTDGGASRPAQFEAGEQAIEKARKAEQLAAEQGADPNAVADPQIAKPDQMNTIVNGNPVFMLDGKQFEPPVMADTADSENGAQPTFAPFRFPASALKKQLTPQQRIDHGFAVFE